MTTCPICNVGRLRPSGRLTRQTIDDHTFEAVLPIEKCDACGEGVYLPGVLARFELQVADGLARAGIATPSAIRFMRSSLGLTARDLSKLLGVRHETLSRWENGKRVLDRVTLAVMHSLIVDALCDAVSTRDYLAGIQAPRRLGKRIKVDLLAAAVGSSMELLDRMERRDLRSEAAHESSNANWLPETMEAA